MTIKEALQLIEKYEPSFFYYIQMNGGTFSDTQLILYAENILKEKRVSK